MLLQKEHEVAKPQKDALTSTVLTRYSDRTAIHSVITESHKIDHHFDISGVSSSSALPSI